MEESIKLLDLIKKSFNCEEVDIKTYSPLTLAFIGDCVFDLVIRSVLVAEGNKSADSLHKSKSKIVKAQTQSKMAEALSKAGVDSDFKEGYNQTEADVYRRGRNAKSYTTAKNASVSDYRRATGFEAVIGYLYLTGQENRILELTVQGLKLVGIEL